MATPPTKAFEATTEPAALFELSAVPEGDDELADELALPVELGAEAAPDGLDWVVALRALLRS